MDTRLAVPSLPLIVTMQYGSHVYGTDLPTSDVDIKGVFVPTAEDILLQKVKNNITLSTKEAKSKANVPGDTDLEIFSLQEFVRLLLEGQTVALDMLFTPRKFYRMTPHSCWEELLGEKNQYLHSGVTAIARYCQRQAAKYGLKGSRIAALREVLGFLESVPEKDRLREHESEVKEFVKASERESSAVPIRLVTIEETHRAQAGLYLEVCDRKVPLDAFVRLAKKIFKKTLDEYGQRALQAEKNEGVDWKALMHSVRVTAEAKELLLTGTVTFPRPERDLLLRIRQGKMPYSDVATLIEKGLEELGEAQSRSVLAKSPDYDAADRFVERYYREAVMGPLKWG